MSYNEMSQYNGWTNKPTWLINLWMSNDQSSYENWQYQSECWFAECDGDINEAAYEFADAIKHTIIANQPEDGANMYSDLLSFSLAYVNWNEIAKHWLEEVEIQLENED